MSKAKLMRSAVQAIALSGAFASTAIAGEVLLKSKDGNIEVTGNLLEADGDRYVIRTAIGPLSVSRSRVTCEGENCLAEQEFEANFRVLAGPDIAERLLPLTLEGFAVSKTSDIEIRNSAEAGLFGRLTSENGYGEETVKFQVSTSGAEDAFMQLGDMGADIVFTTRHVTPVEARTLERKGAGNIVGSDKETLIGKETLSVVVHPDNSISEIGMQQLRDILQGDITNWKQLGGPDADIKIVAKTNDERTESMLQQALFGYERNILADAVILGSDDEEISARVSEDPYAIGFVSLSTLRGAKPLGVVSQCGVSSYPSEFHAKSGDYPLVRPIVMYHRGGSENTHVADFLDFADSEEFADLVEKAGYVSKSVETQDGKLALRDIEHGISAAFDRYEKRSLQTFAAELAGHDRLSTTFQFRTGSSYLDADGMNDMAHLAEYLSYQPKGTTVTFAGFSDSVGASEKNRWLSLKRAKRIENLVREMLPAERADQIEFASKGFGEIRPRACNTSIEGRHLNRRVEVWITSQAPS